MKRLSFAVRLNRLVEQGHSIPVHRRSSARQAPGKRPPPAPRLTGGQRAGALTACCAADPSVARRFGDLQLTCEGIAGEAGSVKPGRATVWALAALMVAGLMIGGGWLAAWQADRNAIESWRLLAQDRAAQATLDAGEALDQAQMRLRTLARSIAASPSAARARTRFELEAPLFLAEEAGGPFIALALVADLQAEARARFTERMGMPLLGPDRNPAPGRGPAAVALSVTGDQGLLFPGLDLLADARLARCISAAMDDPGRTVTGASFPAANRRLTAVAMDAGGNGMAVGLIDVTALLQRTLVAGLPAGLSVAVAERVPDMAESEAMTIFRHGAPNGMPLLEWETRYAHGGALWRIEWTADEEFRGGPALDFGNALRAGSIAVGGLLLAVLGFAAAARRREGERDRESALLRATADRMTEGICVLDRALTVQAANENYYVLYNVPAPMRRPGVPLSEILTMQLERGDFGSQPDPDGFVAERLAHLRETGGEIIEETLPDGRTLEIRRQRMSDGRLVSLYLDIAERRRAEMERAAASALMAATFEHMSDGLTVIDRDHRLLQWNERFLEFFAVPRGIVKAGTPLRTVLGDALNEADLKVVLDALDALHWPDADRGAAPADAGSAESEAGRARIAALSGERWVQLSNRVVPGRGYVLTYTDVSARMRISDALRRSEERYALAAAGANDGLWDWMIETGHFYTSQRWRDMLGLGRDPIAERADEWFDRVHPKDIEELQQQIDDHLEGRTDHLQAEFRVLHSDGAYLWAMARAVAVRNEAGRAVRLVGSMTDITERKRAEEKLIRDALYDTVTGLPNRALLLDRIEQERRRTARAADGRFAVLLLDLDRFKVVNDSLGHDLGDALLIEVARRLERGLKSGDSLARLSGDEFGVLLTDIDSGDQALDAVHWLQTDLAAAFVIGNQEVFTSASAGIALAGQDFLDAEEMLRAADIAMYKAKERGQSSAAVFDPQMQSRAISQMQMENDLRRAVERDEIEMLYQPIVSLRTGQIAGVEALARWRHPDRGTVVPADFIPLAEDTGLITAIGTEALRMACRQLRAWQDALGDAAPSVMSVNLSSRQLQDPDLVREIELILKRERVDGTRLKLEVTESMIMQNPEMTTRMLSDLKALGVALSIDDFGTGYSSLSYLHRFPFDTLKIDRSFVASMDDKPENMEIVRSITLLAHTLGMDTIAEGVESARHLVPLKEFDCEYGQGYFFATPQPAERIAQMMREGPDWTV
jgi:diguanylate cyclase (GGDEF)-like protein/PAS domain S-box-containing protein